MYKYVKDISIQYPSLALSPLDWRGIVIAWVCGKWRSVPCEHDYSLEIKSWIRPTFTLVRPFLTFNLGLSEMAFWRWNFLRNCMHCVVPLSIYRDVGHIKISDEFNVDLCLTFINFQTSSRSNGWQTTTHC